MEKGGLSLHDRHTDRPICPPQAEEEEERELLLFVSFSFLPPWSRMELLVALVVGGKER